MAWEIAQCQVCFTAVEVAVLQTRIAKSFGYGISDFALSGDFILEFLKNDIKP